MKRRFILLALMAATTIANAQKIRVTEVGRYTDGRVEALEIVSYDSSSKKLFITNAASDSIDIVDATNPAAPIKIGGIDITPYGGGVNSVIALQNGYIAAAIEATVKQDSGHVVIFATDGTFQTSLKVGALPDMVTMTHDGKKILVACEGEPNNTYTVDPEGAIGIIDISGGITSLTQSQVTLLRLNAAPITIPGSMHKPGTAWEKDLEPEYIAVNENNTKAFVICQEANVVITVDLTGDSILSFKGLGFKDHSLEKNAMDPSDKDAGTIIRQWPVKGVYMPDAIAAYTVAGKDYFASANEGDGRDYAGYSSEARVKNMKLDTTIFPDHAWLKEDSVLGRLKTFTADMGGDTDGDGDIDVIYTYGARSFSIWDADGNLVWDSGNDFEKYFATNYPKHVNCDEADVTKFDTRSDDKGVEPEALTIGKMGANYYAFIGLERQGGIMVYDITDPKKPAFETYISPYAADGTSIDKAPEGLIFVPAAANHTGKNLLIASHEVSGTTTIFEIEDLVTPPISIQEQSLEFSFELFPNPADNVVNIKLYPAEQQATSVKIFNTIGQCVVNQALAAKQYINTIALPQLANGIYMVQVLDAQGQRLGATKRLQVVK